MNSRAVTKMCWNAEETGMPNDAGRTGFSFTAKAGQQKKNCTQHSSGIGRTQAQDKATALCVHTATGLGLPTPPPAGVASRCERMRYRYSPITILRGIATGFRSGVGTSFRSGGVAGQASSAGHRLDGRKGKASDTQEGNAATVRKVLSALLTQECA